MATVTLVSPRDGERVRGTVEVRVKVSGSRPPSRVAVVIGNPATGTRPATAVGGGEYVYRWDSTRRLADPSRPTASDAVYWLTARATVDGADSDAGYRAVVTANDPATADRVRPLRRGWRPELAWRADYGGTLADWRASHSAVVGAAYATLADDPVLGARRRAVRVSVPDRARDDDDQPTPTTVRFQSSGPRRMVEGDEFCVGFALLPPPDFPSVYPDGDRTNPAGSRGTSYIAVFQFYGPPYVQGSPFVLQANRERRTDPVDEFVVRGNELNPGDPGDYVAIPFRRGRWTDVVFRFCVSASIERGWVEAYVNQGESTAVRPLRFANGVHRLPRVLLRSDSEPFRTDMQVYRVVDRFERVTLWHTGHAVTRTVAEADPRSYRDGPIAWDAVPAAGLT